MSAEKNLYKLILLISLLITNTSSFAQKTLTVDEKNDFYKSCQPGCVSNQKKLPGSEVFLKALFFLEAYCSCSCARMALLLPKNTLNKFADARLEGKNNKQILNSDPALNKFVVRNEQVCIEALSQN